MKRKAVGFLMFDLVGVAALGSNTQLLSERVWGLQLCYLVSENPLGQGLWDADLSQAARKQTSAQKGRMPWNKSLWERKQGETKAEILMLLGDVERDNRTGWDMASTGLHEGRLRVWAGPAAWASWGRSSNTSAATKGCFQAGKQNLSVPATLLLSVCLLSEVWQTDSPFDVRLVSAQQSTKGLIEGREQTFARESGDEADTGKVGGKRVLLSCLFRLNVLEGKFASVWD